MATTFISTMPTKAADPEGIERCAADPMRQPVLIILILVYLIAAITLSYFFYRFKKEMSQQFADADAKYQRLHKLATIFFITIISMLFLTTMAYIFYCVNDTLRAIFAQLGMMLYILQYLMLFGLLFYRLDLVFRGSPFAISRTLKAVFCVSFVLTVFLGVGTMIVSNKTLIYSTIGTLIVISFFIALLPFFIFLIGPFIYKLHKLWIFSNRSKDMQDLLPAMLKLILLTFPSILSLVFVIIVTAIFAGMKGLTSGSLFAQSLFICIDCMTNFFSLYLGFTNFHSHYMRICGLCHRSCMKCNALSLINPDAEKESKPEYIDSASPKSTTDSTTDKTEEAQSSDAVQSDTQIA